MDLLTTVIRVVVEAHAILEVSSRVAAAIRAWCHGRHVTDLQQILGDLAVQTPASIRALIDSHERTHGDLAAADRAEVSRVLENLSKGARFLSTHGGPRSVYLRHEHLIDEIVRGCGATRRSGEPAAQGSDWTLERFLGLGAFGEVWSAVNPGHPEKRAYKFFTDARAREWVRREQESLFRVRQRLRGVANIVEFKDVAVDAAEVPYIVLEYVGGGSLQDWIESPDRARFDKHELMAGVAAGLASAHQIGIYHRDIKPANIVLTEDPRQPVAKITDFGLAIAAERATGSLSLATVAAAGAVGTWMYLPPEAESPATERRPGQDDVFAFGVCWYQVLVEELERPPYDFGERLRAAGVDSHTVGLVARCLAHPARRFRDANELAEAMDDVPPPVTETRDGLDVQHLVREYLTASSLRA